MKEIPCTNNTVEAFNGAWNQSIPPNKPEFVDQYDKMELNSYLEEIGIVIIMFYYNVVLICSNKCLKFL